MKRLLIALLALLLLYPAAVSGEGPLSRAMTVGEAIEFDAITDFYYTTESSTAISHYQRYRFYVEDGQRYFYHETRDGGSWPQTEEDITVSGTLALSEAEWASFCELIRSGMAMVREESLDDGDDGPWLYIYWTGGETEGREFTFETWEKHFGFEDFCVALREKQVQSKEG